jgi:hypothetical protein
MTLSSIVCPHVSVFQHKVLCSHLVWTPGETTHTQSLSFTSSLSPFSLNPLGYISCVGEPLPHLNWLTQRAQHDHRWEVTWSGQQEVLIKRYFTLKYRQRCSNPRVNNQRSVWHFTSWWLWWLTVRIKKTRLNHALSLSLCLSSAVMFGCERGSQSHHHHLTHS